MSQNKQSCRCSKSLESVILFRKRVAGLSETTLGRFVAQACRSAGLQTEVNVLVTSSRELHSLNRRFRRKDKPTDVLSFPAPRGSAEGFAGDIAISADIANDSARALGHSQREEIKILALHGVLHLAGYNHETDGGAMARKERQLRRKLGLPVGLIERSGAREVRRAGAVAPSRGRRKP